MPRRPRGSIETRAPGIHRLEVPLPADENGERRKYRETFHGTPAQAKERLRELLRETDTRRFIPKAGYTLGEHLDRWADVYVSKLEPNTQVDYKRKIRLHIKPVLGTVVLTKLTTEQIDQLYANLQKDGARHDGKPGGLSASMIHGIHAVLHEALSQAVKWRRVPFNPSNDVTLPPKRRKPKRLFSREQLRAFLERLADHRDRAFILGHLYTGLRTGEVAGLRWSDILWDERKIDVQRTVKRPEGFGLIVGDNKNHKKRKIPLAAALAAELRLHRAAQEKIKTGMGPGWNPKDYVFPTEAGTPRYRSNFQNRIWKPLFEPDADGNPAPYPYVNIHGMRHTFATRLMETEKDAKIVSEILGHFSAAFTLDEYDHPEDESKNAAVDNMVDSVEGTPNDSRRRGFERRSTRPRRSRSRR